jgi:hypothetical protein
MTSTISNVIGSGITDGTGHAFITPTKPIPEGNVTVRATDDAEVVVTEIGVNVPPFSEISVSKVGAFGGVVSVALTGSDVELQ